MLAHADLVGFALRPMPMQVFNAGPDELNALVMFVVDATRPFSLPAKLP